MGAPSKTPLELQRGDRMVVRSRRDSGALTVENTQRVMDGLVVRFTDGSVVLITDLLTAVELTP